MKVGFVGVGKLGKDAAEVMDRHYDVTGYDIEGVYTTITMANTLEGACINKDIIFVALPTPHHPDYDGRYPTSHLPPKDFDYSIVKDMIKKIDRLVSKDTLIVLISTVLPGTIRQEIAPLIKNGRFIYNPYLIAQGTVKEDMVEPEMIIIGTKKGEWTDDTSMALCLAQSLIDKNGFDPNIQMEAYVRWWRQGYMSHTGDCFDIGITVQDALSRYEDSHEPFSGSDDPLSAGNGSIMRLAPVPLFFSKHPDLLSLIHI